MNTYIKMASLIFFIVAGLSAATAQTDYESAMGAALQSFSPADNVADFTALADRFEQIADTAPDQWLPFYYAAYCRLVTGLHQEDPLDQDRSYDKALTWVEAAASRTVDNSEVYALKGYVQYMRLSVDPRNRLYLISDAEAALEKAIELDPRNPRPDFIKGQNLYYTPEAFGGGAQAAKPLLEQAREKFEAFEPADRFAPTWGSKRCEYLLQEVNGAR